MTVVKLCECGCGQPTLMAVKTQAKRGVVKGQFQRYVKGHYGFPPEPPPAPPPPTPTLNVYEQHDEAGDMVFVLGLETHSRRDIDRVAELIGAATKFHPKREAA